MNENEKKMIKEMATHMVDYCDRFQMCPYVEDSNVTCDICKARSLYNANCRIIAEDEIVIKKSEYKELKKYRTDWLNSEKMHLQAELEDTEFELGCSNRLFQKVCEEKKELEKQLEQVKQETAREILALIGKPNYKGDDWYEGAFFKQEQIREQIADEYGIELEE